MKDGFIERGPRVDVAAGGFYLMGHFTWPAVLGALEEHVFHDMGHPSVLRGLIGGAEPHPDLHRRHRGGVGFFYKQPDTVGVKMIQA